MAARASSTVFLPGLRLAALVAISIALACTASSEPLELTSGATVEVAGIVKGDELEVKQSGGSARLRMLGIHAFAAVLDDPQLDALELRARDWLEGNLSGQTVRIVLGAVPKDGSGRFLGYVEKTGTDINRQLVAEGRAVVYS
ncbi:MAG: thermonuclease family protein, partial [Myxococcota bacterium]